MRYKQSSSMTDKIFYLFDSVFQKMNNLIHSNPNSFIDVETVEDEFTVVMSDGTLLTGICIDGVSKSVLFDEQAAILNEAERKLMSYMADGCHYISFYFLRDPDGTKREVELVYGSASETAKNIGLDMEDIIQEQKDVLELFCRKERALILVWSNNHGLSVGEKQAAQKVRAELRKGMPLANDAQDLGTGAVTLLNKHLSFVNEFKADLANVDIATHVLTAHELLREMRLSIDSDLTGDDWLPSLPGDPIPLRLYSDFKPDCSGMLWPKLNEQLFPRAAEVIDNEIVRVGNTIFAPITIELMPKTPEPFQSLFDRLAKEDVPWRMHSLIRGDGLGILGFKELLASYMQFTPGAPENKYLVQVKKDLVGLRDQGEEVVKLQISFCTWANVGEEKLLEKRKSVLVRSVQGWGGCDVAMAEGDALETMVSSTPGAVLGSVANVAAAPLYDAVKMAPLTRPASPWTTGSQPLRTEDGKIIPYQPYSKLQAAWTTLIFSPMGYGKSMFMNYCNLSLILSPENKELPYISIIDIGPSSRGLISLLKGALPKEKRHLAMYARLNNTPEYAVNVFDTRLGIRRPLSTQKAFLVNFLSYLATADDKEMPSDGMMALASTIIDLAYTVYADRKSAKSYQKGVLPKIDLIIEEKGFTHDPGRTKWWDVVDFLYLNDLTHEATLAQRFAVPTLTDMAFLANDDRIHAVYGDAINEMTQETMPKFFWRKISEAINQYPIISETTKFDLGEARVVSLDLDEVTKGSGSDSKRRTGLMYMVAYYVLTNHFFTGVDHLAEMEGEVGVYKVDYGPYHKRFVDSIKKLPKRFCIDEKHRVKGLGMVETQLDTSIREGRKWKVEIMQASQLPDDFSDESIRLATNIFIMGGGNKANCKVVSERFGLSSTMTKHLNNSMRKPSKKGATLLSLIETERGNFEQLLVSTQGPTFLWACNSSSDDAYVRDTLSSYIGEIEARGLLVEFYPSGNLDDEIERRKKIAGVDVESSNELGETPKGLLADIVEELKAKHEQRVMA